MADTPNEAPAASAESEATQNTNPEQTTAPEQTQAPDMQGFTSEQLADMKKFFDANGGFDAIKSKISNPPKAEEKPAEQPQNPTSHTQEQQPQTPPKPIEGSLSANDFMMGQYFRSLAQDKKYEAIAKEIVDGSILKEMNALGIYAQNQDGSLNDQKVRGFLDLKAQTIHTEPTSTEPDASAAPTVQYVEVGDNIANMDQAYEVLMQDADLKRRGLAGHPRIADAEAYIKNAGKPAESPKS